jgi:hypothetical protein
MNTLVARAFLGEKVLIDMPSFLINVYGSVSPALKSINLNASLVECHEPPLLDGFALSLSRAFSPTSILRS